jgi:hypothetical protein
MKNETMLFTRKWMELLTVTLTEIRSESQVPHFCSYVVESRLTVRMMMTIMGDKYKR